MATKHGHDGVVHIATNAVAKVTSFNLTYGEVDYPEKTAMGDAGRSYQTGGPEGGSGEITCRYDPADTNGQNVLQPNTELAAVLYPGGNSSGEPSLSFTLLVQRRGLTQDMGSVVEVTFPFVVQGVVTEGTVA